MATREMEVRTFEVEYACDAPGCHGVMRPTGVMLTSNPPKFPHRCTICDAAITFADVRFPQLVYRRF
jgi:hypothetical protein